MKSTLILLALVANAAAGPPVLQRITPASLAKLQQSTPMSRLQRPVEGEAIVERPAEQSIIKQSMILHDGQNWTLVPKGAVLFLPDPLKNRVDVKPLGTLLPFVDFLTKNRSWITTNEVTFNQAAGTEALPEERSTFWSKQDKMVIAVHQSGPISVRVSQATPAITQR